MKRKFGFPNNDFFIILILKEYKLFIPTFKI